MLLANTLAHFADEQRSAMEAEIGRRFGALARRRSSSAGAEDAGSFASDQELSELVIRQLPVFFANFGSREMAYVDTLRDELVNADTLRLWDSEIQATSICAVAWHGAPLGR